MNEIVRKCRIDDIPQLMKLFKQIYLYNPRLLEKDYFDWQFKKDGTHLNDQDYNLLVAEQDSKIMGFLGYVPVEVFYQGQLGRGCWPQNWLSSDSGYAG